LITGVDTTSFTFYAFSLDTTIIKIQNLLVLDSNRYLTITNTEQSGTVKIVLKVETFCGEIDFDTVCIVVNDTITVDLGGDTTICQGDTIILNAGNSGSNFDWSTSGTNQLEVVSVSGSYWVKVTSTGNCFSSDTVDISIVGGDVTAEIIASSTKICLGKQVILTAKGGETYLWTPNLYLNQDNTSIVVSTPNKSVIYQLVVTGQCNKMDSAWVTIEVQSCMLYIPNAFTPNIDGENDLFIIRGDAIENLLFKIFDRWGNKVFETNNINQGWNGTVAGKRVDEGVYVYIISGDFVDGTAIDLKGNVTLIR